MQSIAGLLSMRIDRVAIFPISIPLVYPFTISTGSSDRRDSVIVKVWDDDGCMGLGESAPSREFSEETQETSVSTLQYLARSILGEDPLNIEKLHNKMDAAVHGHPFSKAAIDMAMYDLAGRRLQTPAFNLLGGCICEEFALDWAIGLKETSAMVEEAIEKTEQGFKSLKIKVGVKTDVDIRNIESIKEAVGDSVSLKVDANQALNLRTDLSYLSVLDDLGLEYIEQPLPKWDLEGMSILCKAIKTPIMADESVFSPQDALMVIAKRAADIVHLKIHKHGGLLPTKTIAKMCETALVPCFGGGMLSTSIAVAAASHLFASTGNILPVAEFHVGLGLLKDDVVTERIRVKNGNLKVRNAPGLGLEVDEGKLKRYSLDEIIVE
jgi:L-alanine-DL-glutamate epimerase-like enolase superfamily enzyme